jgi:hypothetical protein
MIKTSTPDACILLTVPNDCYLARKYTNPNTAKMESEIFKLAKVHQCAVWDYYQVMGGYNSSQTWYKMQLMRPDRIHFTKAGYELKARLFIDAFQNCSEQADLLNIKPLIGLTNLVK